ncbi:MAG: FAD-dependent oxidoreductase [Bacteroidales bacterium]
MHKIDKHPILKVPASKKTQFLYNGHQISGEAGFTIAAALHQAGFPVHSHSLKNRNRSLECGIGKCGACEMLVDGQVKRICITKTDGVKQVKEIPKDYQPQAKKINTETPYNIYTTTVAIIGAGPAGLAAREKLTKNGIDNIVIDNNEQVGGQFIMQTHQFFFFEKEKHYGGMRGFDIAKTLAGESPRGIFLNATVWDILEGKRLAVKNLTTEEIFFVDAEHLIIATGAVPYMPAFENDDVPGVYTAAVIQKMMNIEFTLLGKNVLTVGAGNIGYLTSYQLMQAGANVKGIIEAMPREGGFPVQANRVRRLGVPVMLNHLLIKAIPNKDHDGIVGAVVAESKNFKPVPGTEKEILGIDSINICTGLVPDDPLLVKGKEVFGRNVHGCGDAIRIGEGTSAVLRGKQVAYEIMEALQKPYNYQQYLKISKGYLDSQQEPEQIIETPYTPETERMYAKPFVLIDCLHGFACNPCAFACPYGAITKSSTSTAPQIDFDKCIGCMKCINLCPGLAIFGYDLKKNRLFLPVEHEVKENTAACLVDNNGNKLGEAVIEKVLKKPNKTDVVRLSPTNMHGEQLTKVRGFIPKENYPEPVNIQPAQQTPDSEKYICHCDDVTLQEIMNVIGNRKFISVDELKHNTRLGMGACRGKRCIKRLKTTIAASGIQVVGEATPRGPMSNPLTLGELYPARVHEKIYPPLSHSPAKRIETEALVAGGGIGGSAIFRYLAEAGKKPVLINYDRGSSWRNIAGGRPNFSLPELSDIATQNLEIFKKLQDIANIDYRPIKYVTFAHDQQTYKALQASTQWSEAEMIAPEDFRKYISPYFNPRLHKYQAALVTSNCWQATPGKVLDLIRKIGIQQGGEVREDTKLIDVKKQGKTYIALVRDHQGNYIEYHTNIFINALGPSGHHFTNSLGLETGLFPVKHQAFITRRMPWMGVNNAPLPMIIDRRKYKGFVAVYGQQLAETGQVIGCASPQVEPNETDKNLKINSQDFLNIVSEIFVDWLPKLSSVGLQAVWSGYYVEPRMILDPEKGLFLGLRGQGFMLGQYLAKLYVNKLLGKNYPQYFDRFTLEGDGMPEKAFK